MLLTEILSDTLRRLKGEHVISILEIPPFKGSYSHDYKVRHFLIKEIGGWPPSTLELVDRASRITNLVSMSEGERFSVVKKAMEELMEKQKATTTSGSDEFIRQIWQQKENALRLLIVDSEEHLGAIICYVIVLYKKPQPYVRSDHVAQ